MWKVIYIAYSKSHAEKLRQLLTENGFLVQVKTAGGKHSQAYEICSTVSEAEDAYEVLCEHKFQC